MKEQKTLQIQQKSQGNLQQNSPAYYPMSPAIVGGYPNHTVYPASNQHNLLSMQQKQILSNLTSNLQQK